MQGKRGILRVWGGFWGWFKAKRANSQLAGGVCLRMPAVEAREGEPISDHSERGNIRAGEKCGWREGAERNKSPEICMGGAEDDPTGPLPRKMMISTLDHFACQCEAHFC